MLILPAGWRMNGAGEIFQDVVYPGDIGTSQPTERVGKFYEGTDTGLTIIKRDGTRQKVKRRRIML